MRRSLLNKLNLSKSLRQALVLFTMLLLPSAAWGQDPTINTVFTGHNDGFTYGVNSTGEWSLSTISNPDNLSVETSSDPTGVFLSTNSNSLNFDFISKFKLYGTVNNGTKIATVEFDKGTTGIINFYVKKGGTTIAQQTVNTNTNTIDLTVFGDVSSTSFSGDNIDIQIASSDDYASIVVKSIKIYNLQTAPASPITVAGNSPDSNGNISGDGITLGTDGKVSFTPGEGSNPGTLTLKNATITGPITYNGTSNLTIDFSGTNSVSTSENYAIQYEGSDSARPKLTFSLTNGSETGSLNISGDNSVILGFADVDFGNLNLASTSSPGVYYDSDMMRDYSGNSTRELTITTAKVYPIWVKYKQETAEHTQLTSETPQVNMVRMIDNEEVTICTVSYDATNGKLTIEANENASNYAFQPGSSNAAIVVGPSMEALKVHLKGNTKITDSDSFVFSIWDTTSLTFTTDETSPGSLTGTEIVWWNSKNSGGNGQISCENGLIYNAEANPQTISTSGVRLKIGNTPISTNDDITITGVSFNASSNTLTLTDATIESDIQVYVDDFKVEISGTNTIYGNITYSGSNYQSSNIQINKVSNSESPTSLKVTNVEGFSNCTWGNDLYLSAHNSDGGIIDVHYQHFEGEGGQMESYYGGDIADVTFSTTPSTAIWVAGISPGADGHFTGLNGVTYTPANTTTPATLTLEGASISTIENSPSPLIVCNGDLTVNLVGNENNINFSGDYSTYVFKNNATTGALTFTSDDEDASLNITSECYEGTYKGLCDGFSTVNFNKDLGLFNRSGTKAIKNITGHAPVFNMSDGRCYWNTNEGILLNATYHYKIDYVDTSLEGSGVEVDLETDETSWGFNGAYFNSSDLLGPCTITAYAKLNEAIIGSNKAKLFGLAETTITLNSKILTPDMLDIQPSIEENDGVNLTISESYDSNVIQISEETGTATIVGVGKCFLEVNLSISETSNLTVLNPNSIGIVTVLPNKPKIEKEEKDYLDTDKITITRTSVEGESADDIKIFYTWDADVVVENNSYVDNPDHSNITLSTYENPIIAQSGTLRAWVGYHLGDDEYLMSDVATQAFTVKKDIASCTVTLTENATYTGSKYEPVVKESAAATTPLSLGTDYTVSYQKVGGETATSMIDAGTYKITITGTGNFGGTKEVANFQISQASLADAAITTLIVGDKVYEYDADKEGFEIPYSGEAIKPNVVVTFNDGTVTVDALEYEVSWGENNTNVSAEASASVTITSKDKNFIAGSSTTQYFKIVPATVTITAEDQAVTYNANAQEYDVSKVEVSNNNAELAVTYYATEDERNDEENALEEAPTDAGTYYVQVTQTNSNYTAEAKNVTFTINQLELTNDNTVITLENEELTYNGEQQTVIVTKVMVGDIEVPIDCYEVSGNTEKEAGDYKLTVTAKTMDSSGNPIKNNFTGSAEKDWKIKNRTASAAELGFNSETQTFSTYYNPNEDLYLPDGYMSYVITGINDNNSVSTQRLTNIPKGIAVLVEKGTNSENPTDVVNNPDLPLKGTAEPREVSSITGGTVYVLYNGEFVKSTRGTIPAKRCYLLIENRAAAGTRAFGINHHMGANGIDSALLYDNDEKAGDKWHDLQGRSIEKPTKAGLYIKNGKKMVKK